MAKRLVTRAYKYGLSTIRSYARESAGACRELKASTEMCLRAVGLPAPAIPQKQHGDPCNYNDGRAGTQGARHERLPQKGENVSIWDRRKR